MAKVSRVETIKANMLHRIKAGFLGTTGQVNGYTIEPCTSDPQVWFLIAHCPTLRAIEGEGVARLCLAAATTGTSDENKQSLIDDAREIGLYAVVLDESSASLRDLYVTWTSMNHGEGRNRVLALYNRRREEQEAQAA